MIEVNRRGAGLWIFMNRPEVLNALHPDMIAAINQSLDATRHQELIENVLADSATFGRG